MNRCEVFNNSVKDMSALTGGGLPSAYQQVEYIYCSNDRCLIATGVTAPDSVDIKYQMQAGYNFQAIAGSIWLTQAQSTKIFGGIMTYWTGSYTAIIYGWEGSTYAYKNDMQIHTMQMGAEYGWKVYKDGEQVATMSNPTAIPNYEYQLFSSTTGYTATGVINTRIYYCKLHKDGDLVSDLIPCYRKSDNVVGMYDLVSKTFIVNTGSSGNLIAGPDV